MSSVSSGDILRGSDELKGVLGSAGKGKVWHHIVEQCQIEKSGFNASRIQNMDNVMAVDETIHNKISGYYNSIDRQYSSTLRVRDWLAGQSYEYQYQFVMNVLKSFGY